MACDPNSRRPFGRRFGWAAVAVVCVGLALGVLRVRQADRQLRADLLQQATVISWALNATQVDALSGTTTDLDHVLYQRVKDQLVRTRILYPLCQFLYLMKKDVSGNIIFLVDSEPPDSENYSPPGQVYDEATPVLHDALDKGKLNVEGPVSDRWGSWISALVPIFHPYDDRIVAVLGMDVDARQWRATILKPVPSTILFTVLLLMVLAAGYLLFIQHPKPSPSIPLWRSPEVLLTLMTGLSLTLIAAMLARDNEQRAQREAFLRKAVTQASLVQQAMFRLGDNYLEGLGRLFVGSEFVDRAEFARYVGYLLNRPYGSRRSWTRIGRPSNPRYGMVGLRISRLPNGGRIRLRSGPIPARFIIPCVISSLRQAIAMRSALTRGPNPCAFRPWKRRPAPVWSPPRIPCV